MATDDDENSQLAKTDSDTDVIGALVAGYLSWSANHSFAWLLLHVLLNWAYIYYRAIRWVVVALYGQ